MHKEIIIIIESFVLSYIIGSFPTAYIWGRVFFNLDIRQIGSGNVGATNALRFFGVKAGIIVLLIDMIKGMGAVLLTKSLIHTTQLSQPQTNIIVVLSAVVVVLGHIFTIFLKFKGGKGVATAAGIFIALSPYAFLTGLCVFLIITSISRYVSLGSIMAAVFVLIYQVLQQYLKDFNNIPLLVLTIIIVTMIILKHRQNILRLSQGTEHKISLRKK